MSREWKPGDVAICGLHNVKVVKAEAHGEWLHPNFSVPQKIPGHNVRPLVVIDPESKEDAHRLACLLGDGDKSIGYGRVQDALREFANPKPPKPDEPQGLGAVVEARNGDRWVRVEAMTNPDHLFVWVCEADEEVSPREWLDVDAVKVLREGVTP